MATDTRLLLFELRGGDYAHPGSEEAIDLVMKDIAVTGPVLDVGCGYGGTLNYFQQHGFTGCIGIDIDKNAIKYAKDKYPHLQFHNIDALRLNEISSIPTFNLVYAFNSTYAIEDKKALLATLSNSALKGAKLVIFDYMSLKKQLSIQDLAGKEMYPIQLDTFLDDLRETGWNTTSVKDLSAEYITWYEQLLEKLRLKEPELLNKFSAGDIRKVEATLEYFLTELHNEQLGGVLISVIKEE